jgi:tetratricopeptide (TPR) repeat protein
MRALQTSFCALLLLPFVYRATARAETKRNSPAAPDFTRPQTFLKLADAFADEQDYYRAITEYKKVIHLFPDYEKLDWVHFQIGKMYYEGGRYAQAKHELLPLTDSRDGYLSFLAHNYIALTYYENTEYANAERLFGDLRKHEAGAPYITDYTIYMSMAAAGNKKFSDSLERMREAEELWKKRQTPGISAGGAEPQYQQFFEKTIPLLEKASALTNKSPFWAATFSALLPGGGHFLLGEWDTGIVSLSLVGGAAFLAYDGFMRDSPVQWIIFTTFATGAYIGQIYSSYRTARKYNEELGDAEFRELNRHFRSLNVALQFQARF